MILIHKSSDVNGKLLDAAVVDERKRQFYWSRKLPVKQLCHARNPHGRGQAENWWRKAGKHDARKVEKFLEDQKLIETKFQRHARIAREAIG